MGDPDDAAIGKTLWETFPEIHLSTPLKFLAFFLVGSLSTFAADVPVPLPKDTDRPLILVQKLGDSLSRHPGLRVEVHRP